MLSDSKPEYNRSVNLTGNIYNVGKIYKREDKAKVISSTASYNMSGLLLDLT